METNKIKYGLIDQYLKGKLDPKLMHELEKQALEDPFLSEALEGYSSAGTTADAHLSMLQRQLEERIARKQENKSLFYFTWQRISVAAAAGLMFLSAGILFWMKGSQHKRQMAQQKQVEVKLTPADSLDVGSKAGSSANVGLDSVLQTDNLTAGDKALLNRPVNTLTNQGLVVSTGRGALTNQNGEPITASDGDRPITTVSPRSGNVPDSLKHMSEMAAISANGSGTGITAEQGAITSASHGVIGLKSLRGRVISKADGTPLAGVSVMAEGGQHATVTNAQGEFAIADSSDTDVRLASPGYIAVVRKLQPGQPATIALESDYQSGVPATGRAVRQLLKPEPVPGWLKYRQYLKINNRLGRHADQRGSVIVSFNVNSSGILSDFKIVKGLSEACNKEAVRLVEEGPAWYPSSGKDVSAASVAVEFGK